MPLGTPFGCTFDRGGCTGHFPGSPVPAARAGVSSPPISPRGISGRYDPAFRAVAQAFAANFSERDEIGASVAVSVAGRMVVDLWGGLATRSGRPWDADTVVDVFSVGKGMVALSLLMLVDRGRMAFTDLVTAHWPAFAQGDKGSVTVDELLSHQAGLPGIRRPLPDGAMYDWSLMTSTLAAETPWWEPGSGHGYHVNTLGFLGGELVRRITGLDFGSFFATHVAGPLGADFYFGLDAEVQKRAAEFVFPEGAVLGSLRPDDPLSLVYGNPPGVSGLGTVNTAHWRAAVHPSTNGHANARGIARIYGALLGRAGDRDRLVAPATLAAGTAPRVDGPDRILERSSRFAFGFQLSQPERPLGSGSTGFGHFGAGGSLGFADPTADVAFGYAMNRFGHRWQDPRNQVLIAAVYGCL